MKKALVMVVVGIMFSACFLTIGYAQAAATAPAPQKDLLQQELGSLGDAFESVNSAFGNLKAFMDEIVREVKGNMSGIDQLNGKLADLGDVVQAISIELKTAEGKIIGLRSDVDGLSSTQQELQVRIVALESGLSELSASCDDFQKQITATMSGTQSDLAALSDKVDMLAASLADLSNQFASYKDTVAANFAAVADQLASFKDSVMVDVSALNKGQAALEARVKTLEDQDVGTFKKKVLELERSMSALSIKIDNNRAKLEGFDQAIAGLASDVQANKASILANANLIEDHDARITALEGGAGLAELKSQIDGLYVISIIALLAGVGALVWGFMSQ